MSNRVKQPATAKVRNHYCFKRIMTGSDLSRRRLPVMCATSENPGPVVWLTACSHGNEVSGIVVIQEVFKSIRRRLRCGSVQAFPLMNPLGFEAGKRHITMSGEDLNRSFPGNPMVRWGSALRTKYFQRLRQQNPIWWWTSTTTGLNQCLMCWSITIRQALRYQVGHHPFSGGPW